MQPLARDTSLEAEARQLAVFRAMPPTARLAAACDLTAFATALAWDGLVRRHPAMSEIQRTRLFVAERFGDKIATHVRQAPILRNTSAVLAAALPVTAALDDLHISACVAGSIAIVAHGMPRTIDDVIIAADLAADRLPALAALLCSAYHVVSPQDRADSPNIQCRLLHHLTGIVVGVVQLRPGDVSSVDLTRAHGLDLPGYKDAILVAGPEDTVVQALTTYVLSERHDDRAWRDAQSILRVQGDVLDWPYLTRQATMFGLTQLLDRLE